MAAGQSITVRNAINHSRMQSSVRILLYKQNVCVLSVLLGVNPNTFNDCTQIKSNFVVYLIDNLHAHCFGQYICAQALQSESDRRSGFNRFFTQRIVSLRDKAEVGWSKLS